MLELEGEGLSNKHLLPNAITYVNMILGAIAMLIGGDHTPHHLKIASLLILIAGAMDKLDGYVARKLGATSEFGKQLDSLCDLLTFGVAPVVLWWDINKGLLGMGEGLISLLFLGTSIFRLARYNVTKEERYIIGLPITIAGMLMGGKHLLDISHRMNVLKQSRVNMENMLMMILLSILMVSRFKIKKDVFKAFLN